MAEPEESRDNYLVASEPELVRLAQEKMKKPLYQQPGSDNIFMNLPKGMIDLSDRKVIEYQRKNLENK